ncbi:MAG: hypothetical protein V7724_13190 [Sediminicola sp.]
MKTVGKIMTYALTLVLLFASARTIAQVVAPIPTTPITAPANLDVGILTDNTLPVTTVDGAVLFYNPATSGPSLTVTASLDDGAGNTFTGYEWYAITTDGTTETETLISGASTQDLPLTALEPGYHKYRVYGLVENGTVVCQSDNFEDIILFVLSPLTVETTFELNGNALTYCANDVPATPIVLSVGSLEADYSTNTNGYANPDASDFDVTYNWFAVQDGDTANPLDLANTTESYEVTLTDPGTYTFFVEVEYTVKDPGSRDYITYVGAVEDAGSDLEIVVSPTPGTPTLTIGSVVD